MSEESVYQEKDVFISEKPHFRGSMTDEDKFFEDSNSWRQSNRYEDHKLYLKLKDKYTEGTKFEGRFGGARKLCRCTVKKSDKHGVAYSYIEPVDLGDPYMVKADSFDRIPITKAPDFEVKRGSCVWRCMEDEVVDSSGKTKKDRQNEQDKIRFHEMQLHSVKKFKLSLYTVNGEYVPEYFDIKKLTRSNVLVYSLRDTRELTWTLTYTGFLECLVEVDDELWTPEHRRCGICKLMYKVSDPEISCNGNPPICDSCTVCASCGYDKGLRKTFVPDLPVVLLCEDCRESYYNIQKLY